MAKKKGGVNRTEKVDEYLLANPGQTTNEVLAGLAAQGTHVSSSLVSQERKKLGLPPVFNPGFQHGPARSPA